MEYGILVLGSKGIDFLLRWRAQEKDLLKASNNKQIML